MARRKKRVANMTRKCLSVTDVRFVNWKYYPPLVLPVLHLQLRVCLWSFDPMLLLLRCTHCSLSGAQMRSTTKSLGQWNLILAALTKLQLSKILEKYENKRKQFELNVYFARIVTRFYTYCNQGFFKENIRHPVWTCGDPISLILGTRFSILGTWIGFLKHLKKPCCNNSQSL